jgi:hypothetical protein
MAKRTGSPNKFDRLVIAGKMYSTGHGYKTLNGVDHLNELAGSYGRFTYSPYAHILKGDTGLITVQRESRSGTDKEYWYAYKTTDKRTYKQYIGAALSFDKLKDASRKLSAKSA